MATLLIKNLNITITIDDEDEVRVSQHNWFGEKINGFIRAKVGRDSLPLSKFLLKIENEKCRVTFKDGDKTNFRKSNLSYTIKNKITDGSLYIFHNKQWVEVLIDADDIDKISKYSWYISDRGYVRTKIRAKNVALHRFVLDYTGDHVVDHKDQNPLNCEKDNLRIVTHSENNINSSSISGVHLNKNSFVAKCQKNGKILTKRFAISEYGIDEAQAAAKRQYIEFREQLYPNLIQ